MIITEKKIQCVRLKDGSPDVTSAPKYFVCLAAL